MPPPSGWLPARVALGIMTALGFGSHYIVRLNINIGLVAMVSQRAAGGARQVPECLNATGQMPSHTDDEPQVGDGSGG